MTIYLKQSTASQEVCLGYFVDSTDGNTEETGLTIAAADIKLHKAGGTTLTTPAAGATHISNGIYYWVADATDTNTLGSMAIYCHPTGALATKVECVVLAANIYDSLIGGTDLFDVSVTQWLGTAAATPSVAGVPEVDLTHVAGATTNVAALATNVDAILTDTAEIGAAGAGLTNIGTIATVTNLTNLPAITANWLTAAGIAAGALDGKGNWNIGKTGYTLTATTGLGNQTADITGSLSGSVGSVTGAVGSVTGLTAATVHADLDDIQARLPAALTAGGNMKSDALAISGSTAAADNLEESTEVIGYGTCTTGGSTTSVVASAVSPTSSVNDQFNGRVMIFKGNTTAALAGQATTISDYDHATLTFTVVALTTAPASGDLFVIL